ncbi:bifunctional diaminohydroxyphosphoribosylaminopyrimidine deaminase/5-amino-6-(5-phosphoribosylamino)uracil reductase RibD [candidate division KSB1 bacterium]|nr:bifunctional diaminohydroxyphosphoribosylaminopyrimidine deaminase/5-amino-6-(5-phosphoribosylamino)uracil reductase RibD [candidate division KSB1 bacterium]
MIRKFDFDNNSDIADIKFMQIAIGLAQKGRGRVSPNPMVGAVIVKNNEIIGQGYHHAFGEDHAEVDAIKNAQQEIKGATMYVTLEPCCFYGKTPPCVNRLIEEQVKRVVIGTIDPDPRVNQKGIQILKSHGIEVGFSPLATECQALIEAYSHHRQYGIPFTTLKFAQTLDGQIATHEGHSQWISSPSARKLAHQLRKENDAVMIGTGTAAHDNPQLNLRLVAGENPKRIVLDAQLRLPLDLNIFQAVDIEKTIVVTTANAPQKKLEQLQQIGVQVIQTKLNQTGQIDLLQLWYQLGATGITSLLVEGGSALITSILKYQLANRLIVAVAPMILGRGTPAVGDLYISRIDQAIRFENLTHQILENDVILQGDLIYSSPIKRAPSCIVENSKGQKDIG